METDSSRCDSILGIPVKGGGRRRGVGCCAPPFSQSDIVIVESTSKNGYWVCLCWSNFSGQDSYTSKLQRDLFQKFQEFTNMTNMEPGLVLICDYWWCCFKEN